MRRIALLLVLTGVAVLALATSYVIHAQGDQPPQYIGGQRCFACHREAVGDLHLESRHAQTAQEGDPAVILGDFTQGEEVRTLQFRGEESPRAFTADDVALVVGTGRYVQRYVFQSEEGTYSVLPVEWNTVDQVWQPYTLAENWPAPAYDWVSQCAGCHVTGMDTATGQWGELGVQCEACHGPGSDHMAAVAQSGRDPDAAGLEMIRSTIHLSPDAETCGQCHSRGSALDGYPYPTGYRPGGELLAEGIYALVLSDDPAHWWISGHAKQPNMQFNEWLNTSHASSLTNLQASERAGDACLECHSADYGWTVALAERQAAGERLGDAPEMPGLDTAQYGVTCASCHNIHQPGTVEAEGDEAPVPLDFYLTQETYGLCVSCHHDNEVTQSVHHAVQEMYEGQSVIAEVEGVASAHFVAPDGPECVTCHMPRIPIETASRSSHMFFPVMPSASVDENMLQDGCSICHADRVSAAGLQQLIDDVQADTRARLDVIRASLTDASPDWVRRALEFVEGDGSLGVHNYVYADMLLDAVEAELGLVP